MSGLPTVVTTPNPPRRRAQGYYRADYGDLWANGNTPEEAIENLRAFLQAHDMDLPDGYHHMHLNITYSSELETATQ
jgi:hypothetical protein